MSAGTGCCVRLLLCTYVHTYLRTLTNGNIGSQPRLLFLSFFRKIHAAPDKYVRNLKEFVYRPHWARFSQSLGGGLSGLWGGVWGMDEHQARPMSLCTYVRTYRRVSPPSPRPPSPGVPGVPGVLLAVWCAWWSGGLVCLVCIPHILTYVRTYVSVWAQDSSSSSALSQVRSSSFRQ